MKSNASLSNDNESSQINPKTLASSELSSQLVQQTLNNYKPDFSFSFKPDFSNKQTNEIKKPIEQSNQIKLPQFENTIYNNSNNSNNGNNNKNYFNDIENNQLSKDVLNKALNSNSSSPDPDTEFNLETPRGFGEYIENEKSPFSKNEDRNFQENAYSSNQNGNQYSNQFNNSINKQYDDSVLENMYNEMDNYAFHLGFQMGLKKQSEIQMNANFRSQLKTREGTANGGRSRKRQRGDNFKGKRKEIATRNGARGLSPEKYISKFLFDSTPVVYHSTEVNIGDLYVNPVNRKFMSERYPKSQEQIYPQVSKDFFYQMKKAQYNISQFPRNSNLSNEYYPLRPQTNHGVSIRDTNGDMNEYMSRMSNMSRNEMILNDQQIQDSFWKKYFLLHSAMKSQSLSSSMRSESRQSDISEKQLPRLNSNHEQGTNKKFFQKREIKTPNYSYHSNHSIPSNKSNQNNTYSIQQIGASRKDQILESNNLPNYMNNRPTTSNIQSNYNRPTTSSTVYIDRSVEYNHKSQEDKENEDNPIEDQYRGVDQSNYNNENLPNPRASLESQRENKKKQLDSMKQIHEIYSVPEKEKKRYKAISPRYLKPKKVLPTPNEFYQQYIQEKTYLPIDKAIMEQKAKSPMKRKRKLKKIKRKQALGSSADPEADETKLQVITIDKDQFSNSIQRESVVYGNNDHISNISNADNIGNVESDQNIEHNQNVSELPLRITESDPSMDDLDLSPRNSSNIIFTSNILDSSASPRSNEDIQELKEKTELSIHQFNIINNLPNENEELTPRSKALRLWHYENDGIVQLDNDTHTRQRNVIINPNYEKEGIVQLDKDSINIDKTTKIIETPAKSNNELKIKKKSQKQSQKRSSPTKVLHQLFKPSNSLKSSEDIKSNNKSQRVQSSVGGSRNKKLNKSQNATSKPPELIQISESSLIKKVLGILKQQDYIVKPASKEPNIINTNNSNIPNINNSNTNINNNDINNSDSIHSSQKAIENTSDNNSNNTSTIVNMEFSQFLSSKDFTATPVYQ